MTPVIDKTPTTQKPPPIPKYKLNEFTRSLKHTLLTTRFNEKTWEENRQFCKRSVNGHQCIYSSPRPVSINIPPGGVIFVLEMHNGLNQIMGIGMIKNIPCEKKNIYEDGNYNRVSYSGKFRIDRTEMSSSELEILTLLEKYCFKGKTHLKRGQGLTGFPVRMMYRLNYEKEQPIHVVDSITVMFKQRLERERK